LREQLVAGDRSGASEAFFELFDGESDARGAAVGAVAGAFDAFAHGEEFAEFGIGEVVAGFDGGFAGHHVEDLVEEGFLRELMG
jgi:hypothetical protein